MRDPDFTAVLRGHGLRVTAPRLATLKAVTAHQHVDADMIATHVRDQLGTVSRQAVYDILHVFTDVGILRCLTPDGGASLYEVDRHDNHHHLLCRGCGQISDVPCAVGDVPCLKPEGHDELTIESAEVIYHGLCADCTALAITSETCISESTEET